MVGVVEVEVEVEVSAPDDAGTVEDSSSFFFSSTCFAGLANALVHGHLRDRTHYNYYRVYLSISIVMILLLIGQFVPVTEYRYSLRNLSQVHPCRLLVPDLPRMFWRSIIENLTKKIKT